MSSRRWADRISVTNILVGYTERPPLHQVNEYIAKNVLPDIRRLLVDNDKVLAACSSIAYNIINPSLKGKTRCVIVCTPVWTRLRAC